jgi:integrase
MAPHVRSSQLETRTQRAKLTPRRKPYSIRAAPGIRLGYRRNEGAGTWSVICADGKGGSWLKKLALADDREDADGKAIMTFWQAVEAAKKLARAGDGPADGDRPATVREALEDYQRHLEGRGQPGAQVAIVIKRLTPALAAKPVSMLTDREMLAFRDGLLAGGIKRNTTTRYWATFCAAMNRAAKLDKRITNTPWKLEALPTDTEARNVILPDDKVRAIVAAGYRLDPAFGVLVEVLAVTGTRISQALKLTVEDLLPGDRLNMPTSKKGKGAKKTDRRPLPITPGLMAKLRTHAANRKPGDRLLTDENGQPWDHNCQNKRFPPIVTAAGLDPMEVTSYALRHSSIVRQLLAGIPIRVVASHHDTSTVMIERHYSAYISDHSETLTRRALLGTDPTPPAPAANDNAPARVAVR